MSVFKTILIVKRINDMKKNPRYEKVSLDEIKSDCHFKDISEQNFLDEFIKKFGIDIKINYYVLILHFY